MKEVISISKKENIKPLITLNNVKKNYGHRHVIKGISLTINKGDRIGIIGGNGAGKSTLSEIISGIRKPSEGTISIDENITMGIQFQQSKYPVGITVYDLIVYYLEVYSIEMDVKKLNELMLKYQVVEFKNKQLEKLSGGQQQRVNILLSLIHNPDFVIFDEISTGLDIEVRQEIFKIIKEKVVDCNKALMLVTHNMNEIEEVCNKFIYLDKGLIVDSGEVKDLIEQYGSVEEYTLLKLKHSKDEKTIEITEQSKHKKPKIKNRFDRIINNARIKGKNVPLLKLVAKYYVKGMAVPFFIIMFPIVLLLLGGFAFKQMYIQASVNDLSLILRRFIMSIAAVQVAIVGISILPQTMIEFKNGVMLKRIGATKIKIKAFIASIIGLNFGFMLFSYFWTILWGGIIFGEDYGWKTLVNFNVNPMMILILLFEIISSIMFGLALSSILGNVSSSAFITISTMIFIPVAILSGTFMPIEVITNNKVLKMFSYINIFRYTIMPMNNAWMNTFKWDITTIVDLNVAGILIFIYSLVVWKKFVWE